MGYKTVAVSGTADKEQDAIALGAHQFINTKEVDPVEVLRRDGGASLLIIFVPDAAL